ncbi:fibronectin type III domain-containing protein [Paenibacillus agricola]|uniref:DUF4214 domain-containing protein n=1 Tax=Paenibacillus agricola TaxID=2716264 RepID=A0ABX0JCG6_9BACL|nr:S-layer homology domain-containing protein [Paenibacillus agricola]NHN33070.1 DUF4214 domain-containing protein [Paenibacillus agricola]
MLFTINRTKWLNVALVSLLLLTICSPFSVAAESPKPQVSQEGSATSAQPMKNVQRFSDVPDTAWYAEAVNAWIMLGILNPKQGDNLSPQLVMTRGDFAKFLAISLGLSPSKSTLPFKDMSVGGDLTGYVTALHNEGLVAGYEDGTFRQDIEITRAEVASLIVTAKKLKPEPQVGSGFRDVPQNSWYAGAIGALTKAGIANGKSKDNFDPSANIVLAEGITLLYRSFYSPSIIQDIGNNGTIQIDGQTYHAGASVQGIFQPSNKAALHNAAIQFTSAGDTIKSVEGLIIGYKDALTGTDAPILFDAQRDAVIGSVIVNSNHVVLANLEIKEDLNLTSAVQSDFFAYNVLVKGKTVFLKDNDRLESQITNIWFDNSDFGQLYLYNSALLKKVEISTDKMSKSSSKSKGEVRTLAIATTSQVTTVSNLYTALFNRAPDTAGLNFWANALNNASNNTGTGPVSITTVTQGFLTAPEGTSSYPSSTNAEAFVTSFYQKTFGRAPDAGGLAFWVAALNNAGGANSETAKTSVTSQIINVVGTPIGTFTAKVDTDLNVDESSSLDTLNVQSGVKANYFGQTSIPTVNLGDSAATDAKLPGSTSLTASVDIGQMTVHDNAGAVNLNVQGMIGSLQITGANSQLVLGAGTSIGNLNVSSGVDPATIFVNSADLASVRSINGQSTAPVSNTNSKSNWKPDPDPNPVTLIGVPSVPTNVTAIAGNGTATVSFDAPLSDGGSAITGYTVTSSPGGFTGTGTTASPITVTGLMYGTAYTFTVVATNIVGDSAASLASGSVTPVAPIGVPSVPTNVTAIAGNGTATATVSFDAPLSDGGSAITGYTVMSSPGGSTGTGTTASPITVTGLTYGTAYTFTVIATNIAGDSAASLASGSVTPVAPIGVPSAPTNVTAIAGNGATVSFDAPLSDGGSAITGYTVTSSPGGFTGTGTTASPITVTGLTYGTVYTFTVVATNGVGSSPASSPSNPVTQ